MQKAAPDPLPLPKERIRRCQSSVLNHSHYSLSAFLNRVWPFEKVYPAETLKFEDHDFPVFHDYRWYLEQLYGNTYMELPPEEDRVTHEPWKIEL